METALKIIAVAILTSCVCLIIKRTNPEANVALAAVFCVAALSAAAVMISPVLELINRAKSLSGLSEALYYPLFKCIVIAAAAKLGADLCRDSGQSAVAGAVEFCGGAAALLASVPLLTAFLNLMEKLL